MNIKKSIFIFDVDSTLVNTETLDDIIRLSIENGDGKNKKLAIRNVHQIMELGMRGEIGFRESLKKRFAIAKISQEYIDLYNDKFLLKTIDLKFRNIIKHIHNIGGLAIIVSGGFMDNIGIVARKLGVKKERVFANKFIKNGDEIIGFDSCNPLCESNGKVKIAKKIKKDNTGKRIICIGDGNSDYLIKKEGVADEFWGFWANAKRNNLEDKADRNFYSSKQLFDFINKNLTDNERSE